MEVKVSLAALKDTNAQNMKALELLRGRVYSHSGPVAKGQWSKSTKLAHWAKCHDMDVHELVSETNIFSRD